jgi:hypothetical protein
MKLLIETKYRKIYFDKIGNPFYKKNNSKIYINKKLLKYGGNTDELKKLEELFQNQNIKNILKPELYDKLIKELNIKQGITNELRTIFNEIKAIVEKMDDDKDKEKLEIILEIVDLIISICKSTTETEVPVDPVPADLVKEQTSTEPEPEPVEPADSVKEQTSTEPEPEPEPEPADSVKEQTSTEKEQTSIEKEQTSTEKEQTSTEKEQTSTEKEQTSTEKEQTSTEKEVVPSEYQNQTAPVVNPQQYDELKDKIKKLEENAIKFARQEKSIREEIRRQQIYEKHLNKPQPRLLKILREKQENFLKKAKEAEEEAANLKKKLENEFDDDKQNPTLKKAAPTSAESAPTSAEPNTAIEQAKKQYQHKQKSSNSTSSNSISKKIGNYFSNSNFKSGIRSLYKKKK